MALEKQNSQISFFQGLDTKTDPKQISIGKFLSLQNIVFDTGGLFKKRNGFGSLTNLSASNLNTLTTYNGNLTAIGTSLYAFNSSVNQWLNQGNITSVNLKTLPIERSSTSQNTVDVALTTQGMTCTTWSDSDTNCYYQIVDSNTGQVLVSRTQLPSGATIPRVFLIGQYFIVTFLVNVSASPHLRYIAIPTMQLSSPSAATDISTQVSSLSAGYDGQVINNQLYIAWNGSDGGGAVRITYLTSQLSQGSTIAISGKNASQVSITGDISGSSPIIWLTFSDSSHNTWTASFTGQLTALLASTKILNTITTINITSYATGGVNTVFYQTSNTYSYNSVRSDFMSSITCTSGGTVGSATAVLRGVALASKAFVLNSTVYMLVSYGGAFQPTYFLIDSLGNIVAKLAYSNGGGYPSNQILSNSIVIGSQVFIGYLFKDFIVSINKSQGATTTGGIFSQTGINLASFNISNQVMVSSEIAGSIHFASGFMWMYDGVKPVEHGFHLWPEDLGGSTATTGGSLTAQVYNYQVTYEWTDSQGNIHRSAPSVPLVVDASGSGTSTNSNTINIPTLRETAKIAPNKVRVVIYRWSTAQQTFYQVTSITSPLFNDPTTDSVQFVDTLADSSILGNNILYTTGGVVEDIGTPAFDAVTLFKSRLFGLMSEDKNVIWYSKQAIENTPIEMSNLFTIFVPPTTGAQQSTGPNLAITSMDDKLIIFKRYSPYYLTGNGPDNTGANNDFSEPIIINSPVTSSNQNSFVLIPEGLMFQAADNQGIWLLGRDLNVSYIGADVEAFNSATVLSAVKVPGTKQVRFTLNNGVTLMYDYFYKKWCTFNVAAISSTIFNNLHTVLNSNGKILQETSGQYIDGSSPVLMSFTTGWLNLFGLQGYQRAYFFYLLGQYITPHKIQIQIAFDYDQNPIQTSVISPDNFSPNYGGDPLYGSTSPYGGNSNIEWQRVFLQRQKCSAFQIILNEIYDPSFGVPNGAGFTMSGLDIIYGIKSKYPKLAPSRSVG